MSNDNTIYEIYKITNILNGKIYVGQTTKGYLERFKSHIYDIPDKSQNGHMVRALRKYGKANFITELIEVCDNKDHLSERERFWIKELQSYNPDIGYNATMGGEGGIGHEVTSDAREKIRQGRIKFFTNPAERKKASERALAQLEDKEYYTNFVTMNIGSKNKQAKLNEEIVGQIKVDLCNGLQTVEIVKKYNLPVTRRTIADIRRLKAWKHARPDLNDTLKNLLYCKY